MSGLATRLYQALDGWISATKDTDLRHDVETVMEDAAPDACAALDADAEAMRIRRAVEESGHFSHVHMSYRRLGYGQYEADAVVVSLWDIEDTEHKRKTADDAYRAAYVALVDAGKVTP